MSAHRRSPEPTFGSATANDALIGLVASTATGTAYAAIPAYLNGHPAVAAALIGVAVLIGVVSLIIQDRAHRPRHTVPFADLTFLPGRRKAQRRAAGFAHPALTGATLALPHIGQEGTRP